MAEILQRRKTAFEFRIFDSFGVQIKNGEQSNSRHLSGVTNGGWTGSSFAYACSCADPSQRERFRKSKAVFLGEVLEYKERPGVETNEDLKFFPYQVTFKVEKQWKGKRQPEITAFASFDSPGMCGDLDLQMGERFLIYAPYKYEHLLIYRDCGPNRIAENAEDEIKRLGNFFFRTTTFFYPYPKF